MQTPSWVSFKLISNQAEQAIRMVKTFAPITMQAANPKAISDGD